MLLKLILGLLQTHFITLHYFLSHVGNLGQRSCGVLQIDPLFVFAEKKLEK